MKESECKEIGSVLGRNLDLPYSLAESFFAIDSRIEVYFIKAEDERIVLSQATTKAGYALTDKYGYGWEFNRDIKDFVWDEHGKLIERFVREINGED